MIRTQRTLGERKTCTVCVARHVGLCKSVDERDLEGSAALQTSHSPTRVYDAGEVVYVQGDPAKHAFIVLSGWIALHRDLADGRRQIIRFMLPGSLLGSDPSGAVRGHGATAVTNASACPIEVAKLDALRGSVASLNERYIRVLQADNHHQFEMQAIIGQGSAKERIAGLLGELVVAAIGRASIRSGAAVRMPLTQRLVAEATGLTSIHVNRVLRQLREDGVVEFRNGTLIIIDARKLDALTERRVEDALTSLRMPVSRPYLDVRSAEPSAPRRATNLD